MDGWEAEDAEVVDVAVAETEHNVPGSLWYLT